MDGINALSRFGSYIFYMSHSVGNALSGFLLQKSHRKCDEIYSFSVVGRPRLVLSNQRNYSWQIWLDDLDSGGI